jgi:hypothetical protein
VVVLVSLKSFACRRARYQASEAGLQQKLAVLLETLAVVLVLVREGIVSCQWWVARWGKAAADGLQVFLRGIRAHETKRQTLSRDCQKMPAISCSNLA